MLTLDTHTAPACLPLNDSVRSGVVVFGVVAAVVVS
jgi:hypothetical protein